MLAASCTDDLDLTAEATAEAGNEQGQVEVALNLGGEYSIIYDSPLTRADQKKKLYAVNIYYNHAEDTTQYGVPTFHPYAYGLFDDMNKMKLKLSDKYTYIFECSIVEEDMDKIATGPTQDYTNYFFSYPFVEINKFMEQRKRETAANGKITYSFDDSDAAKAMIESINSTAERNIFHFSSTNNLKAIANGKSYVTWTKSGINKNSKTIVKELLPQKTEMIAEDTMYYVSKNAPAMDRWFGRVETAASPKVTLDMRRIAHGINLEVTLPKDGTLNVEATDSTGNSLFNFDMAYNPDKKNNKGIMKSVFTFSDINTFYNYLIGWPKNDKAKELMAKNPKWDEKKLNEELEKAYKAWQNDSIKAIDKLCCPIYIKFTHKRSDGSQNTYEIANCPSNRGKVELCGKGFIPKRNRMTNIIVDASEIMKDGSVGMYEEEFYAPEPGDTLSMN